MEQQPVEDAFQTLDLSSRTASNEIVSAIGVLTGEIRNLGTTLGKKIDSLGTDLGTTLGKKIDSLGTKVDSVGTKIDSLGTKIDSLGPPAAAAIDVKWTVTAKTVTAVVSDESGPRNIVLTPVFEACASACLQHVQVAFSANTAGTMRCGTLLSGNSGTGKTFFLHYLLYLLSAGREKSFSLDLPVVAMICDDETVEVWDTKPTTNEDSTEKCIVGKRFSAASPALLAEVEKKDIVVLHDCHAFLPFQASLVRKLCNKAKASYCVVASSPNEGQYRLFTKDYRVKQYYLRALTRAECEKLVPEVDRQLSAQYAGDTKGLAEAVRERFNRVGGILRSLSCEEQCEYTVGAMAQAAKAFRWESMKGINQNLSTEDSSKLVLLVPTDDGAAIKSYDWVSRTAFRLVLEVHHTPEAQLETAYERYRQAVASGLSNDVKGRLFEEWTLSLLRSDVSLCTEELTTSSATTTSAAAQGDMTQGDTRQSGPGPNQTQQQGKRKRVKLSRRLWERGDHAKVKVVTFRGHDISEVLLPFSPGDPPQLCIPSASNFPAFDAAIRYSVEVLTLIQITVGQKHPPSETLWARQYKLLMGKWNDLQSKDASLQGKELKLQIVWIVPDDNNFERQNLAPAEQKQKGDGLTEQDLKSANQAFAQCQQWRCRVDAHRYRAWVRAEGEPLRRAAAVVINQAENTLSEDTWKATMEDVIQTQLHPKLDGAAVTVTMKDAFKNQTSSGRPALFTVS